MGLLQTWLSGRGQGILQKEKLVYWTSQIMLQNETFIPKSSNTCLSEPSLLALDYQLLPLMPNLVVMVVVVDEGGDFCGGSGYSCEEVEVSSSRAIGN
ncbi:hypothetical protein NC652_006574 [Populus alba x Populus x berolinensis]|nr:hypothetical protein NC652_006574 [Populus alba x Populus x berolinensis]